MRPKLAEDEKLTIEEFLAFCEERPDGERWELIEGVAILSPSPTDFHQIIATNLLIALGNWKSTHAVAWVPMIGTGTRMPVSPRSLPQPDVLVKQGPVGSQASPITDDAVVLFEVLSRSNTRTDQAWRRRAYASIPACQHYDTLRQGEATALRYDRATAWQGAEIAGLDAALDLPALGLAIPFRDIYRWTPIVA